MNTTIQGDRYVSELAQYVKRHETALAQFVKRPAARTAPSWSTLLTLGVVSTEVKLPPKKPFVLKFDPHHLYYLLLRFDELAIPGIGQLDVEIERGPNKPMSLNYGSYPVPAGTYDSYGKQPDDDQSSIMSTWSSISSVGSKWWSSSSDKSASTTQDDVKYLYSSCTKVPAIKLTPFVFSTKSDVKIAPLNRPVKDFQDCPPPSVAVPLYAFKNLQSLTLEDLDPRAFLGWDVLAVQLRFLEIKRSGIEDVGELVCDAVIEDFERRSDDAPALAKVGSSRRRLARGEGDEGSEDYPSPPKAAWSQLYHLSLSSNSLTFVPTPPLAHLAFLTSLDLSSNLLIAVPPGLSQLTSLRSLNLSDNMIESLVHVSRVLGAVTVLNLRNNRIDNLAGLDRLMALERIDVRDNRLRESSEVGRLSSLPFLKQVWCAGQNPFATAPEPNWRIKLLTSFATEGGNLQVEIDGAPAGLNERRQVAHMVQVQKSRSSSHLRPSNSQAAAVTASPGRDAARRTVTSPTTVREHQSQDAAVPMPSSSAGATAQTSAENGPGQEVRKVVTRKRKGKGAKTSKRIVNLDNDDDHNASSSEGPHPSIAKADEARAAAAAAALSSETDEATSSSTQPPQARRQHQSRHGRYATDPVVTDEGDLRDRIQRLRDEVGESWLTVLNEQQQQQQRKQ